MTQFYSDHKIHPICEKYSRINITVKIVFALETFKYKNHGWLKWNVFLHKMLSSHIANDIGLETLKETKDEIYCSGRIRIYCFMVNDLTSSTERQ